MPEGFPCHAAPIATPGLARYAFHDLATREPAHMRKRMLDIGVEAGGDLGAEGRGPRSLLQGTARLSNGKPRTIAYGDGRPQAAQGGKSILG